MRIERLGLTRYGRFTDHALDFGPKPAGADFHLVYGPNEAGKSTTLAAWLDLLYGIGTQSPYSFLHPYATMRIDAVLEMGGAERRFARIKRPQASLLDGADQPLPDAAILAELGGIGRPGVEDVLAAMRRHEGFEGAVCCRPEPGEDPATAYQTLATVILDLADGELTVLKGQP